MAKTTSHLLPYMQSVGSSYVFMDDNAPCHRSQVVAVQGSEMDGGVATTKSRSKSNRTCLGTFYKQNLKVTNQRI